MNHTRMEKAVFKGAQGHDLAARLDLPLGRPRAFVLFAHCFTCTKDIHAAARIAGSLAAAGIGVLRFDFTGLGESAGDFSNTNFSSNIEDLLAAVDWLRGHHQAPAVLMGHSLGGAAVLAAAARVPEARGVVTIGAPADPGHVIEHFTHAVGQINDAGVAEVELGGRPFRIRRHFLDDIAGHVLEDAIGKRGKELLLFHSPVDDVVGIDNAQRIFQAAKHPKSFLSLGQADHLLRGAANARFVAHMTAAWMERMLDTEEDGLPTAAQGTVVVSEAGDGKFAQLVSVGGRHAMTADEPLDHGGGDTGPSPYDLLLASLGACTSMTLRMYADHKGLALDHVAVTLSHQKIHAKDCENCESDSGRVDVIEREISVEGNLDAAERERLLEIADKCPVHKTLHGEVKVITRAG